MDDSLPWDRGNSDDHVNEYPLVFSRRDIQSGIGNRPSRNGKGRSNNEQGLQETGGVPGLLPELLPPVSRSKNIEGVLNATACQF